MKATASRKPKQSESWPRKVTVGRESVTVYRRRTALGNFAYMVANYADGKRRIVPIAENLAVWLAPYAGRTGSLWTQTHICFHKRQEATARPLAWLGKPTAAATRSRPSRSPCARTLGAWQAIAAIHPP